MMIGPPSVQTDDILDSDDNDGYVDDVDDDDDDVVVKWCEVMMSNMF